MAEIDIVTVPHRPETRVLAERMLSVVAALEPTACRILVDNIPVNRGFAAGCNLGAAQGTAPIIGFLNPDTIVNGPFLADVKTVFMDDSVVITGNRFGKPQHELDVWGCKDWVCGATFFVRRDFWEAEGGFDEQFWLYFEETDLIRRAQMAGKRTQSRELLLAHASPSDDPETDVTLKHYWFSVSGQRFYRKWPR